MKLMFDCREMARLISDRHEQTLEPGERARFRLHLVMCRNCRTVEEQMAFLHQAMRRLGAGESASGGEGGGGQPPADQD